MNTFLISVVVAIALLSSAVTEAQPISALQQLQAKVIERQRITNTPSTPEPFVDCSRTSAEQLDRLSTSGISQYIFNAMYHWKSVITPNGRCVYLVMPENRGLTSAEATSLITASEMEFPVPPNPSEQTDPAIIRKMIDENPAAHGIMIPDPIERDPRTLVVPPNGH